MSENVLLEKKVQFYKYRKDCKCKELDILWNKIKNLDELEDKCSEYGEPYFKNPEKKNDAIFMNAFYNNVKTFKKELQQYAEIFSDLCLVGEIKGMAYIERNSEKIPIPLKKAFYKNLISPATMQNTNYEFYCNSCKTKIPQIKYPDWGF